MLAAYVVHILPIKTKMPFDIPHPYLALFSPPNNPLQNLSSEPPPYFLAALAQRLGRMQKGGIPDIASAAVWLLDWFRKGGAGRWTSDFEGVGGVEGVDEGVRQWVEGGMGVIGEGETSQNQEKKKKREEERKKRLERWKKMHGTKAVAT